MARATSTMARATSTTAPKEHCGDLRCRPKCLGYKGKSPMVLSIVVLVVSATLALFYAWEICRRIRRIRMK
jgi:hypothetical protein